MIIKDNSLLVNDKVIDLTNFEFAVLEKLLEHYNYIVGANILLPLCCYDIETAPIGIVHNTVKSINEKLFSVYGQEVIQFTPRRGFSLIIKE